MARAPDGHVAIEDVTVIKQTDKALLVDVDGTQHWIPQSQIHDNSEVYKAGTEGILIITDWIAKQRNLT
ncbi:MAG: hypothetical protein A2Y38_17420 [Spirochaetes bacterium GWB1_59_5]|nr:MAG: hypothetical protein A2Y38_17420 [Spirochaetes bacterium GWB1_59_5]